MAGLVLNKLQEQGPRFRSEISTSFLSRLGDSDIPAFVFSPSSIYSQREPTQCIIEVFYTSRTCS